MFEYEVTQLVKVKVYANDEVEAEQAASESTTYWDDWELVDSPAGVIVNKVVKPDAN